MSIKIIAAIGENNELGKNNHLIWRLPKDLQFFREITLDNHIIMGRKTLESLPKKLDQRVNVVLSSKNLEQYYDVICYHSLEDVLDYYYLHDDVPDLFVIGGASIYEEFLPYADTMYLTEIKAHDYEADAYFPEINKKDWNINKIDEDVDNNISYVHNKYTRRKIR